MNQVNSLISIAMATYNGGEYLQEQLDSILRQDCQLMEIVICDDCSTDNTRSILRNYAERFRHIRLFENEINIGYYRNFEKAISLCKGEYIALSDQDDIWYDNHISVLMGNIQDYSLICSNADVVDECGISLLKTMSHVWGMQRQPAPSKRLKFLLRSNYVQGCTCLFHRSLLDVATPFPDGIKYHDKWLGIAAEARNGSRYIFDTTLKYRIHSNNQTITKRSDLFFGLRDNHHEIERYISFLTWLGRHKSFESKKTDILLMQQFYSSKMSSHVHIRAAYLTLRYYTSFYTDNSLFKLIPRFVKNLLF